MAQAARPRAVTRLMLLLVVPYWINEILRAFAFRVMFGTGGVINGVLIGLRADCASPSTSSAPTSRSMPA